MVDSSEETIFVSFPEGSLAPEAWWPGQVFGSAASALKPRGNTFQLGEVVQCFLAFFVADPALSVATKWRFNPARARRIAPTCSAATAGLSASISFS
jgi:hypothetical protein